MSNQWSRASHLGGAIYEQLPAAWQPALCVLDRELHAPETSLGKRYTLTVLFTIVGSIFFLFIMDSYPGVFPINSLQTFVVEAVILMIFGLDFALHLLVTRIKDWRTVLLLSSDFLAVVPSAMVVLVYLGWMHGAHVEGLVLLRLFRLMRVVKLLRVGNLLVDVMGASVLTLVFGTMATHLGIRVLFLELGNAVGVDLLILFDRQVLLLAVTAVGSVFGIALAITFGLVKRKQMDITEMHRAALDALTFFEYDLQHAMAEAAQKKPPIPFNDWRQLLDKYLREEVHYPEMKVKTLELLALVRDATVGRPSMDVPFHTLLVQRMSGFLTRTQVCFHPAFYQWLKRISNLYFLLVMLAAPGLTGLGVQMLVIFVFAGLVIIIDDMDHAVDKNVIIFNSKILPL